MDPERDRETLASTEARIKRAGDFPKAAPPPRAWVRAAVRGLGWLP